MKSVDKKKPFKTMPDGVWESSRPDDAKTGKPDDITTDLQGNGYPMENGNPKPMPPTAKGSTAKQS